MVDSLSATRTKRPGRHEWPAPCWPWVMRAPAARALPSHLRPRVVRGLRCCCARRTASCSIKHISQRKIKPEEFDQKQGFTQTWKYSLSKNKRGLHIVFFFWRYYMVLKVHLSLYAFFKIKLVQQDRLKAGKIKFLWNSRCLWHWLLFVLFTTSKFRNSKNNLFCFAMITMATVLYGLT